MAYTRISKYGVEMMKRLVVSITSKSRDEARRQVLAVYKTFQRQVSVMYSKFELQDMTLPAFRAVIKREFLKNGHITDTHVIDRHVYEVHNHLYSIRFDFYNPDHVRNYLFRENVDEKPTDFLSKFLAGNE
jgi:NADH dehydrogenase (ubiquinone) 1 alpha subcomplex subunit 6